MPMVDIDDLVVEYSRGDYLVRPIDHFSMTAEPGTLVLLLGPSGCGKTTLLSCLSGMQAPTSGRITVDGTEVTALSPGEATAFRRDKVGVVFQAFNLVPSLTALENVMVPMGAARVPRSEARDRAAALLTEVGLADRVDHRPDALSGGQMQRVAIARALALDPPLLVADEPTASLDHVQVETVLRILRSLAARGRTIVVSTHDHRLLPLADVVVDMAPDGTSPATPTETVVVSAGEVLFREGDRGGRLYRVESGTVALTRGGRDLGSAAAGDVFGEMGAVFRIPRAATATAVSEATLTSYSVEEFTRQFGGEELRRLVGRYGG